MRANPAFGIVIAALTVVSGGPGCRSSQTDEATTQPASERALVEALEAWEAGEQERGVELFLAVASDPEADVRLAPILSEGDFARLPEAERTRVLGPVYGRARAWKQVSRAVRARADALPPEQALPMLAAVERVARANSGDDVLAIYRMNAEAVLKSLARPPR